METNKLLLRHRPREGLWLAGYWVVQGAGMGWPPLLCLPVLPGQHVGGGASRLVASPRNSPVAGSGGIGGRAVAAKCNLGHTLSHGSRFHVGSRRSAGRTA